MSYFGVQSYRFSGRGAIIEDAGAVCKTSGQAVRMAERMSHRRAGAVAFERRSNDFDEYAEPQFLAAFGKLPEEVTNALPGNLAAVVSPEDSVADGPIGLVHAEL